MIATIRCDATAAWQALREHYTSAGRAFDLRTAFASDAGRYEAFALEAPEVFADLSKNLWDSRTRDLLLELAHQCGVAHWRDAMVAGAPINSTEGRAVLHTAIYDPDHERHHPMHTRTTSGKKLSCALFAARHQRLAASIQNKNCHVDPLNVSTACPYGPCYGHFLKRGLCRVHQPGRAAPLGHVATQLRSVVPILRQPVSCQPEGVSAAAACRAPD